MADDDDPRMVSMLDLAIYRGATPDVYERISAQEFARVGIAILGGCARCEATIAVYNAYPSKDGVWRCGDCIDGNGWSDVEQANYDIFVNEGPER